MASTMAADRNRLMKEFNEEKIASQIIGAIAAEEGRREAAQQGQKGKSLGRAAGRQAQLDVGQTRLGMQKEIAKQQETAGMVTAVASSTAALVATLAAQDWSDWEFKLSTPDEYRDLHGGGQGVTPGSEGLPEMNPLQEDLLQYGQGSGLAGQGPGLAAVPSEPELLPGISDEDFLEMQRGQRERGMGDFEPMDSGIPEFRGDYSFDEEFGYMTPWAE